jgi:hypothetical protein
MKKKSMIIIVMLCVITFFAGFTISWANNTLIVPESINHDTNIVYHKVYCPIGNHTSSIEPIGYSGGSGGYSGNIEAEYAFYCYRHSIIFEFIASKGSAYDGDDPSAFINVI